MKMPMANSSGLEYLLKRTKLAVSEAMGNFKYTEIVWTSGRQPCTLAGSLVAGSGPAQLHLIWTGYEAEVRDIGKERLQELYGELWFSYSCGQIVDDFRQIGLVG